MERIKAAGIASGYKFEVVSFKASEDASIVEIRNSGIALFLYENPRRCGCSDFHILLWAASANHHGLPMAVI